MSSGNEAVVRPEKQTLVKEIQDKLDSAQVVMFANYRGLTVKQFTQLRRSVREAEGEVKVYKNTFMNIALSQLGWRIEDGLISGPTILVSSDKHVVPVAKALAKFVKEQDLGTITGGYLDDAPIDLSKINKLASLPSRDVLIAKLLGTLKAPMSRFVMSLSSVQTQFVLVLKAVNDKKELGGKN